MDHLEFASRGGKARAAKLTAAKRRAIAKKGGAATRKMWQARRAAALRSPSKR